MVIGQNKIQGAWVFSPKGNLNRVSAGELENHVREALEEQDPRVVIDMSEMDSISSAGLRVLFMVTKKVKQPFHFVIVQPNELVLEIFEVTGFESLLNVEQTIGAALDTVLKPTSEGGNDQ